MSLFAATLTLLLAGCQGLSIAQQEHEAPRYTVARGGLQADISYQYKYTGTVATWVSEDPTQFSGSALRADVELERTQAGNLRVKVSNVEVAETNEKASCDPQKNIEFDYHPMDPADAALLEQTFLIQVDAATVEYLKVPEEPLWVTNVRRGIIYSLPLAVLTGHNPSRLTFRLTEDTMIGQCYNWYSQIKLSSYQSALEDGKQEEKIEVDVQRYITSERIIQGPGAKGRPKTKRPSKTRKTSSKTSSKTGTKTGTKRPGPQDPDPARLIQPINDTLWVLTRTLDNEGCEENHFTVKINGNDESADKTQRSSQGTFLIRGELGGMTRLERAEVNGNIVVYTTDCHDKFIRTKTKQVLELRAVRHAEVHVESAQELERRTLSFETKEGPLILTVEEQLTGIYPTELQAQAIIAKIKEDMELLNEPDHSENTPPFLDTFRHVVERIAVLPKSKIESLISQVPDTPRVKKTLYQALLTSGTKEALAYLLEKLSDEAFQQQNPSLVFQVFQASTMTVTDPSLIPTLLQLVDSMDDRRGDPLKTTALLSIAKLARQYCLDPQVAESCDQRCDNGASLDSFLPILTRGLNDPLKWKQLVHLQAMCMLGTPLSLPYLEDDQWEVRISWPLSALILDVTKSEILVNEEPLSGQSDKFVVLLNNPSEFPEERSMAFLVISTWEPTNLSWWEHIALSTWRESSHQVAAFIYSALTALSEGNHPRSLSAKKVVHLAKHPGKMETNTLAQSAYIYLKEDVENCKEGENLNMAWVASTLTVFPAIKESEDSETFFGIFEELQEQLMLTSTSFIHKETFTFASILEPLHILFSSYEGEHRQPGAFGPWSFLDYNRPIIFRFTDSTLAFPLDLGLPVIVKLEEDFGFYLRGDTGDFELGHKHSVNVKTLVPWTEGRAAGAGLESNMQIRLPLRSRGEWRPVKLTLTLPTSKVNLIEMSGCMYTSLTPLFPFTGAALSPEEPATSLGRKVVWKGEVLESSSKSRLLDKLGIHLTCEWTGDFQQPGDPKTVIRELHPNQLHYQNFEYRLVFDPTSSQSKVIVFIGHYYKKEIKISTQGPFEQVSQGATDYDYVPQVSGGSSDFEIFSQTSSGGGDFVEQEETQTQTVITHMQRVEELAINFTYGVINSVSLRIEPDAGPQKYEFAISLTTSKQEKLGVKAPTNFHLTFANSSVTEIFGDSYWTCIDASLYSPYLTPLMPKEVILETDLSDDFLLTVKKAAYCEDPPILYLKARQDVSTTALEYLQAEAERETCDGSFPQRLDQDIIDNVEAFRAWSIHNLDLTVVDVVRDRVSQSDNLISVDALLNLKVNEWKLRTTGPHGTFVYSVPAESLDVITSSYVQNNVFDVISSSLDKVCYLTTHSIRTFDGLVHEFEPSSCWTTAAIHIPPPPLSSLATKALQVAVQARYIDDQWEVRISWPLSALILDVTKSEILVNEEPLSGQSDKFVVHRLQDSQLVEVGRVLVWVGNTVEIRISDVYYAEVTGLCGNYDGEPSNDMKGPLGCLYTDPALHTTAWSSPALGCSRLALRAKKRKLEEFQDTCDKEVFRTTGLSQQNVMENCTAWEYHERTSPAGLLCRSRVPVPVCLPGCEVGIAFTSNLKYDCSQPSSSAEQQQQYDGSRQCLSKVLPATIAAGCFRQIRS
nr:tetrodotoxin binding protein [Hemigrapsus sanguineus]